MGHLRFPDKLGQRDTQTPEPIRFPQELCSDSRQEPDDPVMRDAMACSDAAERLLAAFDDASRRIEDLARELDVLPGSDDDGPRAA